MDYKTFQQQLVQLADPIYADFASGGTPTEFPFLGVRIPYLRDLAKQIITSGDAADFLTRTPQSFEEIMTQGIVTASLPYEDFKSRAPKFIKQIDNWGVCDTFCNTAKSVKKHREDFLASIIDPLLSPAAGEFEVRVALVMLLCHYVTPDYLAVIYDRVTAVKDREEYYVKMAIAWLLAECFVKFPDETYPLLAAKLLPAWTQNKTISKIRDSYRVPDEVKDALKQLRL